MRRTLFSAASMLALLSACSPIESPVVDASALPDTTDHTGPYEVTARVQARRKIHAVTLVWENRSESTVQTQRIDMPLDTTNNVYSASIPGQGTGAVIAFHVEATDDSGDTGADPSPGSIAQCGDNYCFHVLAQ